MCLYLSAVRYWNKVNFKGMKQSFADGGGTDNLAVIPLIRRKVRHRHKLLRHSTSVRSSLYERCTVQVAYMAAAK